MAAKLFPSFPLSAPFYSQENECCYAFLNLMIANYTPTNRGDTTWQKITFKLFFSNIFTSVINHLEIKGYS
jgi:hypothetical protein